MGSEGHYEMKIGKAVEVSGVIAETVNTSVYTVIELIFKGYCYPEWLAAKCNIQLF